MATIRQALQSDLSAFYTVSLKTGHLGGDATSLYSDPKMMGHIYSAPYLLFEPGLAFAVEEDSQVVGFCVGTTDTRRFQALLEKEWWPDLRKTYRAPKESLRSSWSADERRAKMIHEPETTPDPVLAAYPAHMHMNLLPGVQGQGLGGDLLKLWARRASELGAHAVHLGVNAANARALGFWGRNGFKAIPTQGSRTVWLGRAI